ncbi:hypothetical protein IEO21_09580 [Rhodonia placenta]|uniref:Uncharacterized protein n=1 Tax=Rhodonia placenta TaxID=104341 RepID=A0A8H7TY39_9APHY|nr:hypothetical protein IEO21_09580 [Postia placenta]
MAAALLSTTANIVITATPVSKPAVEALVDWVPHTKLQKADEAQAATLTMLESTTQIMDREVHDVLQHRYDMIAKDRAALGKVGLVKAWRKMKKIRNYNHQAVGLNQETVVSRRCRTPSR